MFNFVSDGNERLRIGKYQERETAKNDLDMTSLAVSNLG
jgi:hypothetical protein